MLNKQVNPLETDGHFAYAYDQLATICKERDYSVILERSLQIS